MYIVQFNSHTYTNLCFNAVTESDHVRILSRFPVCNN